MLPYGVERTGSGISTGFQSMCGTNALEHGKRYRIETSLNPDGEIRRQKGISHEQIAQDRFWNKRPDGIVYKVPTKDGAGVICLLEFKRMSDVTRHYIVGGKHVTEVQYVSLKSTLVIMKRSEEKLSLFRGSLRKCRTHPLKTSYENI